MFAMPKTIENFLYSMIIGQKMNEQQLADDESTG